MSDDIAPSHVITPGRLRHAYQASLNQLVASDSLQRLWAKDPEFDALQSRQQCVVRLHLSAGLESGLTELEHMIHQALSHTRVLAR